MVTSFLESYSLRDRSQDLGGLKTPLRFSELHNAHIKVSCVVREEFLQSIPSTMKDPQGSFWLA